MGRVLELMPILDTPGYSCFGSSGPAAPVKGGPSLWREFFPSNEAIGDPGLPFVEPFGTRWKPVRVLNPLPGQVNDYPAIGGMVPCFSRRAVSVLEDLLRQTGEVLDLLSDEGDDAYKAFHVTCVLDALDEGGSDVELHAIDRLNAKRGRPRRFRTARAIHRFSFVPEVVEAASIFRIPQLSHHVFVTDRFEERVRANALRGFDLRAVWEGTR